MKTPPDDDKLRWCEWTPFKFSWQSNCMPGVYAEWVTDDENTCRRCKRPIDRKDHA